MGSASPMPASPLGTPHVLIADDDADFLALISGSLRDEGYRVTTASTGSQLRRFVERSVRGASGDRYSLILSDVNMPEGSGLEALAGLRGTVRPPFIAMTAFATRETHAAAFRLGAIGVIDKPFAVRDLCAVVSCFVGDPLDASC